MLMKKIGHNLTLEPSLYSAPIKNDDRRNTRRRSVLLRSSVYPVDAFFDARIRDVSATGIRGESDLELAIGQTMHVTTDELTYHAGTVKWVQARQFGLHLPDALYMFGVELGDIDHGHWEGHQPRAPRVRINPTARLLVGRPPRPGIIRNVSSTGMLLDTGPGLRPGQHLVVRAGNAHPVYGRVQWSKDGRCGFKAQNRISILSFVDMDD